jgi:hypothetical protein
MCRCITCPNLDMMINCDFIMYLLELLLLLHLSCCCQSLPDPSLQTRISELNFSRLYYNTQLNKFPNVTKMMPKLMCLKSAHFSQRQIHPQHWWKWRKITTKWSSYNSVCIQLGIERNKIELVDGGGAFEGCELLCTQTWRKSDDIMSDITLIGVNHVIVEEGWWWSVRCSMSPADWCQQIAHCFDIQVGSTSQITSLRCGFQPRWMPAIGPF